VAEFIAADETAAGNERLPYRVGGYRGFHAGAIACGERHDGVLVRVSSGLAHEVWRALMAHSDNCSRIDVQVTSRSPWSPQELIERSFQRAKRVKSGRGRPPRLWKGETRYGPETLEIGVRVSGRFGRMYDKGVQSRLPDYAGAIRCEEEIKGKLALKTAQHLLGQHSESQWCTREVSRFFRSHGCVLGFESRVSETFVLPARVSDDDRCLAWLSKSCRSSVERLRAKGKLEEVMRALGLLDQWSNVASDN
jgi:hypothetical protein